MSCRCVMCWKHHCLLRPLHRTLDSCCGIWQCESTRCLGKDFVDGYWYHSENVPIKPEDVRFPNGVQVQEHEIPPLLVVDMLPEGYIRGLNSSHYQWTVTKTPAGQWHRRLVKTVAPMTVKGLHILWRHSNARSPRAESDRAAPERH